MTSDENYDEFSPYLKLKATTEDNSYINKDSSPVIYIIFACM